MVIVLGATVVIMAISKPIVLTKENEIKDYWNSIAKPFALQDWSEGGPGAPGATTIPLTLIIENTENSQKNLTMIRIDNATTSIIMVNGSATMANGSAWIWPVPFERGQVLTITVNVAGCRRHQSAGHTHIVELDYDNIRGLANKSEIGDQPIMLNPSMNSTNCGD